MELVKEIKFNLECVGRILPEDNDNIDAKYPSYIMKTSMEDYPYILVEDVRSIFEFSRYNCWNCDEEGITQGTDKIELTDDYECGVIIRTLEDELFYHNFCTLTSILEKYKMLFCSLQGRRRRQYEEICDFRSGGGMSLGLYGLFHPYVGGDRR